MRFLLSVLSTLSAGLPQEPAPGLLKEIRGLWRSPGGNILDIRRAGNGTTGYMFSVTESSREAGFKKADVAVRNVAVQGGRLHFEVAIRGDDPSYPRAFVEFKDGRFEGRRLVGLLREGGYEGAPPVYQNAATFAETSYERVDVQILRPGPVPLLGRLERAGPAEVVVDALPEEPLGVNEPRVAVRVMTLGKQPIPKEEVEWTLSRGTFRGTFHTTTGAQGEARLDMVMLPTGDFAPANQIRARPERTVPPGNYDVRATVPALGSTPPVTFRLSLKAGILVRFQDDAGQDLPFIVFGEEDEVPIRISITDRRVAAAPGLTRPSVTLQLTSQRLERTVAAQQPGQYADNYRYMASRPRLFGTTPPQQEFADIVAYIPELTASARLRMYPDPIGLGKDVIRLTLEDYKRVLEDGALWQAADAGQRAVITQKRWFVTRGLAMLDLKELALRRKMQLAAGRAYLGLVQGAGLLPERRGTIQIPISVTGNPQDPQLGLPYLSLAEAQRVRQAILQESMLVPENLQAARDEMVTKAAAAVRMAPEVIKKSPQLLATAIGAYAASLVTTIVYGMTLEGDDVDAIDRLVAGLDVATLRLFTPPRLRLWRSAGEKRRSLAELRIVEDKYHFQIQDEATYRQALHASRFAEIGDQVLDRLFASGLPDEVKRAHLLILARASNYKTSEWLRRALRRLEEAHPGVGPGTRSRRDIGHITHLMRYHEGRAYWEYLIEQGRAVRTSNGGYREMVNGKLGDVEEMFEWRVTKEDSYVIVDHLMINHRDKTITVTDLTGQLTKHLDKTKEYGDLVEKLPAFQGYKAVAVEFYWDEQSAELVERVAATFGWEQYP